MNQVAFHDCVQDSPGEASAFMEPRDQQLLSQPTAKDDFVNVPDKLCTEIVVRHQMNQVAFR